MKNALLAALTLSLCAACGPAPQKPVPDAGPDTSCGLDCVAQARYGLTLKRCFEYTNSQTGVSPASLGVEVKPVEKLEGDRAALPLEYTQGGQPVMTDYFFLTNGDLLLARRTFQAGHSVTYKDSSGNIVGTPWLKALTGVGEKLTGNTSADVVVPDPNARKSDPTAYKVTTAAQSPSEKTVPAGTYPDAFKMILSENPNHGVDPRRVFMPGTGFTVFASAFSDLASSTAQEYRLQKIRDLGTADAGTEICGLGAP
jgi:hypothetical protein